MPRESDNILSLWFWLTSTRSSQNTTRECYFLMGMQRYASHVTCSTEDVAQENQKAHCESSQLFSIWNCIHCLDLSPLCYSVQGSVLFHSKWGSTRYATIPAEGMIWRCIILQPATTMISMHSPTSLPTQYFKFMWLSLLFHI